MGGKQYLNRRQLLAGLMAGAAAFRADARFAYAQQSLLLDERIVATVLGILQPASVREIHAFLTEIADSATDRGAGSFPPVAPPGITGVADVLRNLTGEQVALVVDPSERRYSLTRPGSAFLGRDLVRLRDTTRLFLLRGPRNVNLPPSCGNTREEAGGASPSQAIRSTIEEAVKPFAHSEAGRLRRPASPLKAAVFDSGFLTFSRDTSLRYLSFASLGQVAEAGGTEMLDDGSRALSAAGLALCLGVSDSLLWSLAKHRDSHYRAFTLTKKTGGTRVINAPRIFLKTAQRFLLDYILADTLPHPAVYSFVPSRDGWAVRKPVTNADLHRDSNFVASADIADFFGSIRSPMVRAAFERLDTPPLAKDAVALATRLCTFSGPNGQIAVLPQGAPTSPHLSNLVLFEFDRKMTDLAARLDLVYSRYADDITFSGGYRRNTTLAIAACTQQLRQLHRIEVNRKKTRIMSRRRQQRVTGLVINEKLLPPRELRRRIRAMFHQASHDPAFFAANRRRMQGYLAYFKSIPGYPETELKKYADILAK